MMKVFRFHRRLIAFPVVALMLLTSLPMGMAQAAMVSTEQVIVGGFDSRKGVRSDARERVKAFLKREDVRAQLEEFGVDPKEAMDRVAALSDEEVERIAGKIDRLPAGGNVVGVIVGAIVLVFIVLLITDIFCVTKIFPFTKCVNKDKS
jgi:hypothetical protein